MNCIVEETPYVFEAFEAKLVHIELSMYAEDVSSEQFVNLLGQVFQ